MVDYIGVKFVGMLMKVTSTNEGVETVDGRYGGNDRLRGSHKF